VKVLAFDTSTPSTVVGLLGADGIACELCDRRGVGERPGHQQQLLALAVRLLEAAGLGFGDLDRIAVGVGPGTYTGLRVGVASARGIAQALGLELVGVSSLAALAYSLEPAQGQAVLTLTDARRGELFAALYLPGGEDRPPQELLAPRPLVPAALPGLIGEALGLCAGPVVAAGDLAESFGELLGAHGIANLGPSLLGGGALAKLGALAQPQPLQAVVPDYRRPADAERAAAAGPFAVVARR